MMKTIVILFDDQNSKYKKELVFNGKSAESLCDDWAQALGYETSKISAETLTELLEKISTECEVKKADSVVFAFNDCPFINQKLSEEIITAHNEYKSEYTFADGYPNGFAPELIHSGTVKILLELSKTTQSELGKQPVRKDSLFNLIKTDINSFEVETIMAPEDWRLLRLNFDCSKKENFYACKALLEECAGDLNKSVVELSQIAEKSVGILKTVPGFYNIQISNVVSSQVIYAPYKKFAEEQNFTCDIDFMPFDSFKKIIKTISDFSEQAVVSLSAWGEALAHPDILKMIEEVLKYEGLSVFIESDGQFVTDEFCSSLKVIVDNATPRTNGWNKVMIALCVDAVTPETYAKLHNAATDSAFNQVVEAVGKLYTAIPGNVYPQFTRMNENEQELETFFRFWKEKTSPSGGELIIQKYDDFAGHLPSCKPADLSPLNRNPCWHLRRDLTILINGQVPVCRECRFGNFIGNVFEEKIDEIWSKNNDLLKAHSCKKYEGICGNCDEHYTFNF